jgi:hypothetical protein
MNMTTTEQTPREIDEAEAALYEKLARVDAQRDSARDRLYYIAGYRPEYTRTGHYWKRTLGELMEDIDGLVARGNKLNLSYGVTPSLARKAFDEVLTEQARVLVEIERLEAIYRANPWTRYFPCLNADGHIHSSLNCPTCRPTTPMGWTPQLSGKPAEDAVAELGPVLCTVCFPEAPVEWKREPSELRAGQRAAEKAEREAKKARKNLLPGEVITVNDRFADRITTVAAAKDALRKEVEFRDYFGHGPHVSYPAWAEAAVAAKAVLLAREEREEGTGATQAEIDRIITNAVKRNRAEGARI